jgi:hypothetical protein
VRLNELGAELPLSEIAGGTRERRRAEGFPEIRDRLREELCADVISGTRWDTLICDGWLPLLAARGQTRLAGMWFHWFAGDLPPFLTSGLRQLGYFNGREQPACHGAAQGLLGWFLAREPRR